jgi:RNA polymerase sigma factor (sigma-70 family)
MPSLLDQFTTEKLTPSEEAVLANEIAQGSEDALVKLVMANMHEALRYTQRVCRDRIDEPTRASLCYQEMTMSGRRFRAGRIRFFAFAKAGLRGRLKTYYRTLSAVRHVNEVVSSDGLEDMRWPNGRVSKRISQHSLAPEDDHESSFREMITGEVEVPNMEALLAKDHWEQIRKRLHSSLSEQQWMILDLTYKGDLNFPQIGKLLGLTRSAIHASHKKAILKLRAAIQEDKRLLL